MLKESIKAYGGINTKVLTVDFQNKRLCMQLYYVHIHFVVYEYVKGLIFEFIHVHVYIIYIDSELIIKFLTLR